MFTTVDETGRLNNYAREPQVYLAAYPSLEEQRAYLLQSGVAALLVTTLLIISAVVS
jgi:hypothetical protein